MRILSDISISRSASLGSRRRSLRSREVGQRRPEILSSSGSINGAATLRRLRDLQHCLRTLKSSLRRCGRRNGDMRADNSLTLTYILMKSRYCQLLNPKTSSQETKIWPLPVAWARDWNVLTKWNWIEESPTGWLRLHLYTRCDTGSAVVVSASDSTDTGPDRIREWWYCRSCMAEVIPVRELIPAHVKPADTVLKNKASELIQSY